MAIKAKLLPRWPSAITGTAPIVATKANGAVALSYDSSSLPQVSSPTGSGKVVVREGAVYNEVPALNIAFPTIANNTLVGNNSGGTAAPSALTAAQAAALLPAMTGDSGSGGVKGLVPAPAAGDAAAGRFLSANGTFTLPSISSFPNFTGDSGSGGARGLVPGPAAGDALANKFVKADGNWSTPYRETIGSTFWKTVTVGTTVAYQARIADRLFVGAAVANDGKLWLDGSYPANGFSELDWLGVLTTTPVYNGVFASYGNDVNFAQSVVLYDHTAPPGSQGVPQIAFLASIQSPNATIGATPRAGEFLMWNNPTTVGAAVAGWALYVEAHRLTTNTSNTYGMELAIRNVASSVTGWNPYTTPGVGSIGIEIQCGAGLTASGQFPATVAMYIAANPAQFGAGIIFLDNSIGTYGIGSSQPAMLMPFQYSVQWYANSTTLAASMYGDAFSNFYINLPNGGTELRVNNSIAITNGQNYKFGNGGTAFISGSTASSFVGLYTSSTERARANDNGFVITGALFRGTPVTKATSFSLAATENWVICNGAGTITVTLPAAASYTGREVMIKTIAAQTVVSASSNVVPLAGGAAGTAILAAVAGRWATLVSDGTNWVIQQGN